MKTRSLVYLCALVLVIVALAVVNSNTNRASLQITIQSNGQDTFSVVDILSGRQLSQKGGQFALPLDPSGHSRIGLRAVDGTYLEARLKALSGPGPVWNDNLLYSVVSLSGGGVWEADQGKLRVTWPRAGETVVLVEGARTRDCETRAPLTNPISVHVDGGAFCVGSRRFVVTSGESWGMTVKRLYDDQPPRVSGPRGHLESLSLEGAEPIGLEPSPHPVLELPRRGAWRFTAKGDAGQIITVECSRFGNDDDPIGRSSYAIWLTHP